MARRLITTSLATMALLAALTGAASANWTTNGTASGIAFAGTATKNFWTVKPVGRTLSTGWQCPFGGVDGILTGPSFSGPAPVMGQLTFASSGCFLISGMALWAVKCDSGSPFSGLSYSPVGSLTAGSVASVRCVLVRVAGGCGNATTFTGGGIVITGTLPVSYGNTSQQLSVDIPGQSLRATWTTASCLSGTGTGTATGGLIGDIMNGTGLPVTYRATSTFRPNITN
jgi:hypothetical protein